MDFTVKELPCVDKSAIRRGLLNIRGHFGEECTVDTPGCFFHTHFGSIPHLTPDDLQYIEHAPSCLPLNMTLSTAAILADAMAGYEKSLGSFTGYPSSVVYMSLHDPLVAQKPAMHDKATMAIWNRTGKKKVSLARFMVGKNPQSLNK